MKKHTLLALAFTFLISTAYALTSEEQSKLNSELLEAKSVNQYDELITKGADINAKDSKYGGSLLHWSIYQSSEIVDYILAHPSINVNAQDNNGLTALDWSYDKKKTDVFTKLVNRADINLDIQAKNGNTVLMNAVGAKDVETVKLLIDKGANTKLKDGRNFTALTYAINQDNKELQDILFKAGVAEDDYESIRPAERKVDTDLVIRLVENGLRVKNSPILTYLSVKNYRGEEIKKINELVTYLLDKGADINAKTPDTYGGYGGQTCLMLAMQRSNHKLVKLLLIRGADVSLSNQRGKSTLELMVETQGTDHIEYYSKDMIQKQTIKFIEYGSDDFELMTKYKKANNYREAIRSASDAIAHFKNADMLMPYDVSVDKVLSHTHYQRGMLHLQNGNRSKGIRDLKQALREKLHDEKFENEIISALRQNDINPYGY